MKTTVLFLSLLLVACDQWKPREIVWPQQTEVIEQYYGLGWRMSKFSDGTWWYSTLNENGGIDRTIEWRWK